MIFYASQVPDSLRGRAMSMTMAGASSGAIIAFAVTPTVRISERVAAYSGGAGGASDEHGLAGASSGAIIAFAVTSTVRLFKDCFMRLFKRLKNAKPTLSYRRR